MSLVERVIRLAVENLPISSKEKDIVFSNTKRRSLREWSAAALAPKKPIANVTLSESSVNKSIFPPAINTEEVVLPGEFTSSVISCI